MSYEGFSTSTCPTTACEINEGFFDTDDGAYNSISESFFFNAALAFAFIVVDNYLAIYFLLSFFFYYFIIFAGYENNDGLQFDFNLNDVGTFKFGVTPINKLGVSVNPIKLI